MQKLGEKIWKTTYFISNGKIVFQEIGVALEFCDYVGELSNGQG